MHNEGIYDLNKKYKEDKGLLSHKVLNLILYDVWESLYGKEFADSEVGVESKRTDIYKQAWDWALSINSSERMKIFNQLKAGEKAENLIH